MKFSYIHSASIGGLFSIGYLLAFILLLSSCSNELPELSVDYVESSDNTVESHDSSLLRFQTIEELENISVADIPGEHEGFELKELSYECVDTIELRALRFDVRAKLSSSSKEEKVVVFSAEVGPELVSVEYYPGGEMMEPYCNMATRFYPKVERYRNYSDSSRIGPDEFYDFGHFQTIGISCSDLPNYYYPSVLKYDKDVIPFWDGGNVNSNCQYYKNGVFHFKNKYLIEHNLNTTLIEKDGTTYQGEDFFNIIHLNDIYDEPSFREPSLQMIGNYSMYGEGGSYLESYLYDDEEAVFWLNLCNDVPDVSPIPFPVNTESREPGWYFGGFHDNYLGCGHLLSRHDIDMDRLFLSRGLTFSCYAQVDLQYLVIDNRIIHFDDYALKNYCGIRNINPKQTITKTSDGYLVTTEQEFNLYGERCKAILEIETKGVSGPVETVDNSSYDSVEGEDRKELDRLDSQNETTRSGASSEKSIRSDGKRISIDRTLPRSLRSITKTRTVISTDR